MNTHDLKLFEAVAQHGSFTKAAEETFTVQSNVTARIKSLEEEFGAQLFNRSSRKVDLTPEGETLMKYSRQISNLIEEAKKRIEKTDEVTGKLRIGCIETTMALKAPGIMKNFAEVHPKVQLEFTSAMRNTLIQDVLNLKLDAAFISAPIDTPDLQQHLIKEEQLVIIAGHQFKKAADILKQDLQRIIVFDQGCVFRSRLESWLLAHGTVQYQSTVLNSIEGVINFVEAGLGISILPAEVVEHFYSNRKINLFPVNKELSKLTTLLVYRKDVPPTAALKAFVQMHG